MATPQDNLQTLHTTLAHIQGRFSEADPYRAAFWDAFYDLYLMYLKGSDPAVSAAFTGFINDNAAQLEAQMYMLESAQFNRMESKLTSIWEFDEWLTLCRQKSALEGFNALCGPHFSDPYVLGVDDEFDDDLKARGDSEGFASYEEDPALFPESHWWWTYIKPVGKFGM